VTERDAGRLAARTSRSCRVLASGSGCASSWPLARAPRGSSRHAGEGQPEPRAQLPDTGLHARVAHPVVVVSSGARACPLGFRCQQRVGPWSSAAPPGLDTAHGCTEPTEHLSSRRRDAFRWIVALSKAIRRCHAAHPASDVEHVLPGRHRLRLPARQHVRLSSASSPWSPSPTAGSAQLVGHHLDHRPAGAVLGLPGPLLKPAHDHHPAALRQRLRCLLGLVAPHHHRVERRLTIPPTVPVAGTSRLPPVRAGPRIAWTEYEA
jgi:hypothetical protein